MSQNPSVESDDEAGAFAVPDDVDWENTGFADEDLSGRPTRAKKQAAPRPVVDPQAQALRTQRPLPAQPIAPARHVQPTAPHVEERPQTPAQTPIGVPAHPQSQPTAKGHSQADQGHSQADQGPTPASQPHQVAAQPYPSPTRPLPTQAATTTAGEQYLTAPATGYTPAIKARLEDLSEPEWARIVPTRPGTEEDSEAVFTGEAFEQPLYPVQPNPALEHPTTPVRSKRAKATSHPRPTRRPRGKAQPTVREGKTSQFAGGRWKVKVLRAMIFTVLGVLILGGFKNVVSHKALPTTAQIAQQVEINMGQTGFPTAQAENFAVRFAREYLTYSPQTADARNQRLAVYSPAAASGSWGWNGSGSQTVITGPYVAAPTKINGKHFATVTVSAQLSDQRWVALAIPVYADDIASLVVSGPPAYVALPAAAKNPGKNYHLTPDDALDEQLTPQMALFFTQWAIGASNWEELSRYLSPDATIEAKTGLGGAVQYDEKAGSSVEVVMPSTGGSTRTGTVTVVWATPSAGTMSQAYTVTVVKGDGGRWYVKDVEGGVVSSTEDVTSQTGSGTSGAPIPGVQ